MFGDHLPRTRWQRAVTLAKVYNSTVPGVEMVGCDVFLDTRTARWWFQIFFMFIQFE